jgi:hypothetical protein
MVYEGFVAPTADVVGLNTRVVVVPTNGKIVASVFVAAKSCIKSIVTELFCKPPTKERLPPNEVVSTASISYVISTLFDNEERSTALTVIEAFVRTI